MPMMDGFCLEKLLSIIDKTFPVPFRFRAKIPGDVAELSRLLTSTRGERDGGYLNRPYLLSAYLRYFLPWNVFRLGRLLSPDVNAGGLKLFPSILADGDAITDLGSGPLVLPIALWIACPSLRRLELEFRCVDKSAAALEAGYRLFNALTAASQDNSSGTWKIKLIRDSMEKPIRGRQAKLTAALNVFNEISAGPRRIGGIEQNAKKAAALLCRLCADDGSILAVEPGNPQGGTFIAALRSALLEKGIPPAAPCPHAGLCPLPGTGASQQSGMGRDAKVKWCHFAFNTETAPQALHQLSAAAGIPKERATLSFLLAGPKPANGTDPKRIHNKSALAPNLMRIRIISDTFSIPLEKQKTGLGCYGCSEKGMVLVAGNQDQFNSAVSGALLELPHPAVEQKDHKTGAIIIPLIPS